LWQTSMMIEGWMSDPLFGKGHGAVVSGVRSSDETPWAYESTYPLLLHNVGLVGVILYISGIVWIYYNGLLIIKKGGLWGELMKITLVSLTCFLVANSTNPYLGKFDSVWILFMPIAIINMLHRRQNSHR
jgi:hypothetical protein